MSGAAGAAAGVAIVAAYAEAIKASGVMVHVTGATFQRLVSDQKAPLILRKIGRKSRFAWAYEGYIFWCKVPGQPDLPGARFIDVKSFSMPMM